MEMFESIILKYINLEYKQEKYNKYAKKRVTKSGE